MGREPAGRRLCRADAAPALGRAAAARLTLAAVGRAPRGALADAERLYAERIHMWPLALAVVEERRKLPPEDLRRREGELLMAAVPAGATLVALDERGRTMPSLAFAERLRLWQDEGVRHLAFVLGGADGLAEPVRAGAALCLAFGAMTWPHILARIMLLEQIYRAQTILAGHPYHRE